MGIAIRACWDPIRVRAFGTINAVYSTLGTKLAHPARLLIFQNSTDVDLYISFNGVDDNLELLAYGYMIVDLTSNKTIPAGFYQPEGDQIYVKDQGAAPSLGKVSLSVVYGAEL
jgi:hypothetical protein